MINLSKCKVLSVKAQTRLLECCPLEEGEELTSAFYNTSEKTFILFYRNNGVENTFTTALNHDTGKRLYVLGEDTKIVKHANAIKKWLDRNDLSYISLCAMPEFLSGSVRDKDDNIVKIDGSRLKAKWKGF